MAYTTAELEKFLTELELPEDKRKIALEAIGAGGEKVLNSFGAHVLRQSDYSAKMDELQKEKDRLEADVNARIEREDAFHSSVAQWKTTKEKEAEDAITKARQESQEQLRANAERIRKLAAEYFIPEDQIKDLTSVQTSASKTEPARDPETGKFVTREQLETAEAYYTVYPFVIAELRDEYRRLYGADAPSINGVQLVKDARANKRTLEEQFNITYKMNEKRAELAETSRKAEIEKARKEGEESARSKILSEHPELSHRAIDREHVGSAILNQARKDAGMSPDKARQTAGGPQEAVSEAVKAFQEGRYKGGVDNRAD